MAIGNATNQHRDRRADYCMKCACLGLLASQPRCFQHPRLHEVEVQGELEELEELGDKKSAILHAQTDDFSSPGDIFDIGIEMNMTNNADDPRGMGEPNPSPGESEDRG
ncbi:hypothetical protein N8T08_001147 [Aspergillus melleus]|uniref:Uncharacterized protein n=1 Tax=Aspergillus melleus TaxID=138277 RepID=A0ACC3ANX0_9EURO|nr:hypothetical protein N8T08_001147 [Aspergillus melleus]